MAQASRQDTVSSGNGQKAQKAVRPQALTPWEEMDRIFEGFFPRGWMHPLRWGWPLRGEMKDLGIKLPRVDIIDRDDNVLVRAEVPGVDKKDLDVSVNDSTVTIKGSTRREEKEEEGDYFCSEITSGAFARTLPGSVDSAKAKATFKDGVLELILPKVEKSKRHTVRVE